jgi:hypothetical protein
MFYYMIKKEEVSGGVDKGLTDVPFSWVLKNVQEFSNLGGGARY